MQFKVSNFNFFYLLFLIFLAVLTHHEINQFTVVHDFEDFRTAIGRFCFEQLQILIYAVGFIMVYVILYNKITYRLVFQNYMLAFLFIVLNGNVEFHEILVKNDLYLKFTQTNQPFFLHAFGVFGAIVSVFSLGYLIFVKPTILKVMTIFFGTSFYIFFLVLHLFLGRQAYIDYLDHYQNQIHSVLNNNQQYQYLCPDLKYQCFIISKESIPNILITEKNKMKNNIDVTEEVKEVFIHFREDFLKNNYNEKIYITESFSRKNLRAMNFAFKKMDNQLFVIVTSSTFAYGLDLYLFYITILSAIFMILWTSLLVKLNKFHSKLPWLQKNNLL